MICDFSKNTFIKNTITKKTLNKNIMKQTLKLTNFIKHF